ncbi:TPA: large-conductance mechanosensitive channel protein MscL [Legionella pneumophila]|nr:large-conductance mechanosensitive channel protein MscL [Legionella pneumophila]HAT8867475.1 large-conductance mechanosensitive channel protein MscL [Legionella pneumophila subsp. pneumophila]HAT7072618.1 large-conductance mechanosensitive channel protein MscL [Legionella pneumophila]HAT8640689.1 large-conductance mechanosensitive channel protein MscL [Legionella pneumophila]HAT8889710.1 large-conductance mechanosensitive channel protein MscL [Legionella pneumophila subsp. pneumophila]HAT89
MSLLKEFKEFAMRGNVMDLAVAVVMGVAFNKIVTALVDGIIMPCVGLLLGGINIAGLSFTVGDVQIKWGNFLQNVIDFIIVAFAIFVLIKLINLLQRKKANEPESVTPEIQLLTEIRDLLARNSSKI